MAAVPAAVTLADVEGRDAGGWLVAPGLRLRGVLDAVGTHPTYGLVPVEHKSRPVGRGPYPSEIAQLTAEAMLLEAAHGLPPRAGGFLTFAGTPLWVPISPAWRQRVRTLLPLVQRLRSLGPAEAPGRSHARPRRCAGCGFRTRCPEALPRPASRR